MYPRLSRAEFHAGAGDPNRRALRALVRNAREPGILAYAGGEPVGWCALAPRADYPRIERSRLFGRDEPPRGTWSVVCFFVARPHRRQGLSVRLLEAAAAHARAHGASVLEGYPVEPVKPTADAFAWTGCASAFRAAGFSEVARPSPTRPLMRRALGRARLSGTTRRMSGGASGGARAAAAGGARYAPPRRKRPARKSRAGG